MENKKIRNRRTKKNLIYNFIFRGCSWGKRKVFANFHTKILIFSVPVTFFKVETLLRMRRARGHIRRFFLFGLIKIYLIGSIVPVFENRKKCYITPPYWTGEKTSVFSNLHFKMTLYFLLLTLHSKPSTSTLRTSGGFSLARTSTSSNRIENWGSPMFWN